MYVEIGNENWLNTRKPNPFSQGGYLYDYANDLRSKGDPAMSEGVVDAIELVNRGHLLTIKRTADAFRQVYGNDAHKKQYFILYGLWQLQMSNYDRRFQWFERYYGKLENSLWGV